MRYRLLAGVAQVPDLDTEVPEGQKRPSKVLKAGDPYETDVDMVRFHGADKWQLLGPNRGTKAPKKDEELGKSPLTGAAVPQTQAEATYAAPSPTKVALPASLAGSMPPKSKEDAVALLDKMSTSELIALADEQEIDLGGKKDRASVLKAIKADMES